MNAREALKKSETGRIEVDSGGTTSSYARLHNGVLYWFDVITGEQQDPVHLVVAMGLWRPYPYDPEPEKCEACVMADELTEAPFKQLRFLLSKHCECNK